MSWSRACLASLALVAAGCQWIGGIDDRSLAATTSTGQGGGSTTSTTTGTGGSGGSGGSTSSAGGGGAGGGVPSECTDGPYGSEHLYFGAAVFDTSFDALLGDGFLSPDGLRFMKQHGSVTDAEGCIGTCFKLQELVRPTLDDAWLPPLSFLVSYVSARPHMTQNGLGLIACHGGELKCAYYHRSHIAESFPFDTTHNYWDDETFSLLVGEGGAQDYAFTPTASGALIAFSSNRKAPGDDTPVLNQNVPASRDLWTADAVDALDPSAGYTNLIHWPGASSPGCDDDPMWLSDSGQTLVFESQRNGDAGHEAYLTSRPSAVGVFGDAQKIEVLSSPGATTDAFSMPSIATLQAHGGRGEGYVRRSLSNTQKQYYRFPVCLGG